MTLAPAYRYAAVCVRVKDGDTFVASVDLGFQVSVAVSVRLAGINAPEAHGETRHEGEAAREVLRSLLQPPSGSLVPPFLILESHKDERSFERWVCDVWLQESGESVQDLMVARGAAVREDYR